MEEKRMTKRDYYEMIKTIVEGNEELTGFINHQIKLLDDKAIKAKEKAAQKKNTDELYNLVKVLLTDEFQSTQDIASQIDSEEEISVAKVRARLTKLINDGIAIKEKAKTEDNKDITVYKLA